MHSVADVHDVLYIFIVQPDNVACTANELQAPDDPVPVYGRNDDLLVTQLFSFVSK